MGQQAKAAGRTHTGRQKGSHTVRQRKIVIIVMVIVIIIITIIITIAITTIVVGIIIIIT